MSHVASIGRRAALSAVVFGVAGVMAPAPARAQGMPPGPPAAGEVPSAPPAGAPPPAGEMPPAYAPPPGYQPSQSAPPGYGSPPPGYGSPPPGYGYPPPAVYAPPPNIHDGLYLRAHLGVGYLQLSTDGMSLSGPGISFGFALGGAIAPNLIIYGTGFGSTAPNPQVRIEGSASGMYKGVNLALVGLGGGLAYYLANNVYLAGTVASMQWSLNDANDSYTLTESKYGIGFQGLVGKEWWVAEDWGVGVAGEVMAATMSDDADHTWTGLALAVLLSATYN